MKKNKLGNTDIWVTPVGFGVMTINKYQLNLSIDEGAELLCYGLKKGINFFDTAQYYETYPYIKEALKRYYREDPCAKRPVICSKSLDSSYEEMKFAVREALREMDLDYIDIFLLHEVRAYPDFENRSDAWRYLQEAKAEGLVKAIGVSTHYVDVAEKMADVPQCDVIFPLINFKSLGIRKGNEAGTCEEMAAAIKKAHSKGKGIFAMKAFGGGNLTGSYLKALDYVSGLAGIDSIMVGMGRKEEIDRIIQYAEGTIDRNYAPDVSEKKIYINQGDCEGCGKCQNACPNHAIYWNENGLADVDHDICLTCGYCAPVCPVRAIVLW